MGERIKRLRNVRHRKLVEEEMVKGGEELGFTRAAEPALRSRQDSRHPLLPRKAAFCRPQKAPLLLDLKLPPGWSH